MPRRSTLTLAERESLFAVPTDEAELIRCYAFSEQELSVIQQHRDGETCYAEIVESKTELEKESDGGNSPIAAES